jgi:hypothetical protein
MMIIMRQKNHHEQSACCPIYQYTNGRLIKPWLKGYPINNPEDVAIAVRCISKNIRNSYFSTV